MQITTRKEAIQQRVTRYYTGEPCANGHVAYRYTKNGGCSDCINPKFEPVDRPQREESKRHVKSLKVARKLSRHGFYLHIENLEPFIALALLYSQARDSAIERRDLIANRAWVSGPDGTQLRQFWIFPEDVPALRAAERDWKQAVLDSEALTRAGL